MLKRQDSVSKIKNKINLKPVKNTNEEKHV